MSRNEVQHYSTRNFLTRHMTRLRTVAARMQIRSGKRVSIEQALTEVVERGLTAIERELNESKRKRAS